MPSLDVSALLRVASQRADLSCYAIAQRSGLPYSTVWRCVNGRTQPGMRTLGRLAAAYGVQSHTLLTADPVMRDAA